MSSFEADGAYQDAWELAEEDAWASDQADAEIADALRSALRDEYADAADADLVDAATDMMSAMSPAEAFNFGAALSQIGKSACRWRPTQRSPASRGLWRQWPAGHRHVHRRSAGHQAGHRNRYPRGRCASPAAEGGTRPAACAAPVPGSPPSPAALPPAPTAPTPVSPVAGGSAAAAQALILSGHPEVKQAALATALGQPGRREISGIPAAQLLGLLSQVFGQAAADADELMYNEAVPDAAEGAGPDAEAGSLRSLYCDLLGADNMELAEAAEWEGPGW